MRQRYHLSAVLLLALGMTGILGCIRDEAPGCAYNISSTGTIRITTVDSPTMPARADKGQPCSSYGYTWLTGGPSASPDVDGIFASDACAFAAGIEVKATFVASITEGLLSGEPDSCPKVLLMFENPMIAVCSSHCTFD